MRRDLIGVVAIAFMGLPTLVFAADTTTGAQNPAVATSPGEESKGKPHIPEASSTTATKGEAPDAMATTPGEESKGKPAMSPQ